MTDDQICGELTDQGELCSLPSGWGRDEPAGPCRHHTDTTRLPRKWSADRVQTIYDELERVPSFKHACEAAGITRQTGNNWKRRGEELNEELSEAEIEQDENARRLVSFFDTVNALAGDGKLGLLSDAMEYARKREDPDALLRIYKQLEGGASASDDEDDDPDELTGDLDVTITREVVDGANE